MNGSSLPCTGGSVLGAVAEWRVPANGQRLPCAARKRALLSRQSRSLSRKASKALKDRDWSALLTFFFPLATNRFWADPAPLGQLNAMVAASNPVIRIAF